MNKNQFISAFLLINFLSGGCAIETTIPATSLQTETASNVTLISPATSITVSEGNNVTLVVLFNKITTHESSLNWTLSDADDDFTTTSGSAIISKGSNSFTLNLLPITDGLIEGDETFQLSFSGNSSDFSNQIEIEILVGDNTTAPVAPTSVSITSISTSSLSGAFVKADDDDHEVVDYEYSVGTTAEATDILTWVSLSNLNLNSISLSGLTLTSGTPYFLNFRAKDNNGNYSSITSDSKQVDDDIIPLSFDFTFDSLAAGSDPTDWFDSGSGNSLVLNDLFKTVDVGGNMCFGTSDTGTNIHTHYTPVGGIAASGYKVRGRMRRSHAGGSLGVTLFSDYNNSDSYYRFRFYEMAGKIGLVPHGTSHTGGRTALDYTMAVDTWYQYEIQIRDTGTYTDIRAKIWDEGGTEPLNWMVSAYDDSGTRLTNGTFGVWSMGNGSKYWDDFEVRELSDSDINHYYETASFPFSEDFESYSVGSAPANWMSTPEDNLLVESPAVFSIFDLSGEKTMGSDYEDENFHSHYMGQGSEDWTNYEITGRMRYDDNNSGLGVTFFSDYPNSNSYYRFRMEPGDGFFEIDPHGTTMTSGTCSSALAVATDTWFQYRIQITDEGTQSRVKAKVWEEGNPEPASFEINCVDANAGHLTKGTVGTWGMGDGIKYWDDIQVNSL